MDNIHGFGNNNDNNNNVDQNNSGMMPVMMQGAENEQINYREQTFGGFLKDTCCPEFKTKSFIFVICIIDVVIYLLTLFYGGIDGSNPSQLLAPTTEALDAFGMKDNYKIRNGQIFRWLFFGLLHANFVHIFFNIFSQIVIGTIIESCILTSKTALLYILSSIGGGMFSSVVNRNANCVGASVAIFGLLSGYIGYLLANWYYIVRGRGYHTIYCNLIFMGLIILMNVSFGLSNPVIDNMGHLGGFIFGFFLVFVLIKPKDQNSSLWLPFATWRVISIIALIALYGLCLFLFFNS